MNDDKYTLVYVVEVEALKDLPEFEINKGDKRLITTLDFQTFKLPQTFKHSEDKTVSQNVILANFEVINGVVPMIPPEFLNADYRCKVALYQNIQDTMADVEWRLDNRDIDLTPEEIREVAYRFHTGEGTDSELTEYENLDNIIDTVVKERNDPSL